MATRKLTTNMQPHALPKKTNEFNRQSGNHEVSVRILQGFSAAPPETFDAWLDDQAAGLWLFATASRPMTRVTIDPRPGGLFEFADDSGTCHRGCYMDIQPGRRLAFSLAWPGSRRGSEVVVEFSRRGSGCLLSLTHSGLPSGQAAHVEARWEGMLYGLGLLLDDAADDEKSGRATASRRPPLTRG